MKFFANVGQKLDRLTSKGIEKTVALKPAAGRVLKSAHLGIEAGVTKGLGLIAQGCVAGMVKLEQHQHTKEGKPPILNPIDINDEYTEED